jgi:DinB superfamily
MLDVYLQLLELDYFELSEAFKGLQDDHVWVRPAEGLLSIGELAGHVAYWEATRFAGEMDADGRPDLSKCKISSPLIDHRFAYFTTTIQQTGVDERIHMPAEWVGKELTRIHRESVGHLKALNPDLNAHVPGWGSHWTWGESIRYTIFHVAYHTGQIYTARHLLGEETPDN